jgi:hypothetical protein
MLAAKSIISDSIVLVALIAYISRQQHLYWVLWGILTIYIVFSFPKLIQSLTTMRSGSFMWGLILIAMCLQYAVFMANSYDAEINKYLARYSAISLLNIGVLLSVIIYTEGDPSRLIRLSRLFFLAVTLSALAYFLGIPFKGVMYELKKVLFPNALLKYEQEFRVHDLYRGMWNSGLTAQLFQFGYHCVAGLSFSLSYLLFQKRNTLLRIGSAIFFLFVAFVSAERSVIFAIFASLLIFVIFYRRAFFAFVSVKYAVSAIVVTAVLFGALAFHWLADQKMVEGPLLSERFQQTDIAHRIQLQAAALDMLQEYPFGILLNGYRELEWGRLAKHSGYNVPFDVDTGGYLEIHNSYLRFVIMFGLFSVLLMAVMFAGYILLISRIMRLSLELKRESDLHTQTQISLAIVFVALVFQAFFHNDSLFTFEPVSWLAGSIILAIGLRKRSAYLVSG